MCGCQFAEVESAQKARAALDGKEVAPTVRCCFTSHLFVPGQISGRALSVSVSAPPSVRKEMENTTIYVRGLPQVSNVRDLIQAHFEGCGEITGDVSAYKKSRDWGTSIFIACLHVVRNSSCQGQGGRAQKVCVRAVRKRGWNGMCFFCGKLFFTCLLRLVGWFEGCIGPDWFQPGS